MHFLLAKYINKPSSRSLHSRFWHFKIAPSLKSSDPQHGHTLGGMISLLISLFISPLRKEPVIFGITSPERIMLIVSPIFSPSLFISPALCKVAFDTIAPSIFTGSSTPTGVIAPVLPTCQITSFSLVASSSGGNL